MASRKIEDKHKMMLEQLLQDVGLECVRSSPESVETSSESVEMELKEETLILEEEIVEEAVKEESKSLLPEESPEEQPEIFPTPSLRKVLPEKVRKIQEHNTIHVLPEEFKTDIDPNLIPKIETTVHQKYIDILAEITGCKEYKNSLAEYWFLDTLANLLRRAQEDKMTRQVLYYLHNTSDLMQSRYSCYIIAQRAMERAMLAVLILWFCEWMKEIQHFDAADRQRMMRRFQDTMMSAARFIAQDEHLPTPHEVNVFYKAEEDVDRTVSPSATKSKHFVSFEGAAYECSMLDLTRIIHYIFDLFSTDYQYELVRSVFTFTPEYTLIDAPYQMRNPKRLYAPLKLKPKKTSPKKDKPTGKGKKKEPDNEEYLALLELRAQDERQQEELEDKDREEWNLRSHILPLSMATDDEFFNKYWPPPPPEPEPEPEPELKGKGKKGKK